MSSNNSDTAHYFTLPGYTWDCMLYKTRQELELLTDIDMYLFVEKGIRGGLSQICGKRRAHANNKYIPTYDTSKPDSYLMMYDINNQYGLSMCQSLPYGGFEWTDKNIDVMSIAIDSTKGYILEVDLEYPECLHDLHKDLPFCPEHKSVNGSKIKKLMATLENKYRYVIHYKNLQQALANGLKLIKVHRALSFNQSPWLKPYIDLNTELRKKAKNEFEKNLYKLLNNAVFGKTMENTRKYCKVKLVSRWEGRYGAEAYISNPEFKTCTISDENLVAIEMKKLEVKLNKPIYVGFSILDIAKISIYDFHYAYMIKVFPDCTLLYTDTDSLTYELHSDPYLVMRRDCHSHFDTSDYPPENIYNIPQVNKKVLGKMKDEYNGVPMTDFVGLRSKLYCTKVLSTRDKLSILREKLKLEDYSDQEIEQMILNSFTTKKAKGVKKSIIENEITFDDFIECLETFKEKSISQNLILSYNHEVYSVKQDKIELSPHDDKRYLLPGTYNTLPIGHYSIKNHNNMEID